MKSLKEHFKFEDLRVYHKALEFVGFTYALTRGFPPEEKYGLVSQFNRATVSVSLNIAEGYGSTKKDFARFLNISKRSSSEFVVCATIAENLGYLDRDQHNLVRVHVAEIQRMIAGLRKSLTK
jgi:four helix bundle protein